MTSDDEIKLQVLEVGICGTDREELAGGRALPPPGSRDLVLGHEMLGRVVAVGKQVTRVANGDLAVFSVRRGCGDCLPCAMNRSDMCRTGNYRERGIWGLDGFQTEFVVDREQHVVRVPPEVAGFAVLTEPLSVVEKALLQTVDLQCARLPDSPSTPDSLYGRRCLVAGLGPIGLLAAMVLRLRGAEVHGLDIVDADTPRPQWLAAIGGNYIDGRRFKPPDISHTFGPMNLIFEGTGIAMLEFTLLQALATNGAYVITGIPRDSRPIEVSGGELMRRLVLGNMLVVGSVNASRGHLQMAVDDLVQGKERWKGQLEKLITHRYGVAEAANAIARHPPEEIKGVVMWNEHR